ncbi:hypothetical protein FRC06_011707 [Ceratobasidium sp. 370]|nr:hypothetical protein FRC06_011707 [Ceratobasidium sp. 370]
MVGRLRIPVDKAIMYYQELAGVFTDKKLVTSGYGVFKLSTLQTVLKSIIRDVTGDENTPMIDTRPDADKCRTMLFAMSEYNLDAGIPRIFRSYHGKAHQMPDCKLFEAMCASMAHPELFKSFKVGEGPLAESFVGGALSCSNPIEHALTETKTLFPGRHVSSITSIGAGHTRTIQIPKPSLLQSVLPINVLVAMKDIATDSEAAAQRAAMRFQHVPDVYFRFSVNQGMQSMKLSDWERLDEVATHARAYMHQLEIKERLDRMVQAITEQEPTISIAQIDGQAQKPTAYQETGVKLFPAPTPVFTGQEDKIAQVEECISRGDKERCVFVVHGMGGAGKTQIALKTVERTRDMWADIVYVDATSRETTIHALEGFAKAKSIGSTHEDTIRVLGGRRERWLMVLDNADDPKLGISDFFPQGNHGSILITTRLSDMALLARGAKSSCSLSIMKPYESLELLLKTAQLGEEMVTGDERQAAADLLQDLGHLALAVVHAGAYIWCSKRTIRQYRDMFLEQRQATLDRYSEILVKVDNYPEVVYTTWKMSYERLSTKAQLLLALMAFMHHDNITEDIFKNTSINAGTFSPLIPELREDIAARSDVQCCLEPYVDSRGVWNHGAFLSTMTELTSHSLISYDRVNTSYTMHVLVHDWASTVIPDPRPVAVRRTMFLLAASVDIGYTGKELMYNRAVETHISRVLDRGVTPNANDAARFARVYESTGRRSREEILRHLIVDASKILLGVGHHITLSSMTDLATNYKNQGLYGQAEVVQLQAMDEYERHPGGLNRTDAARSMSNLASIYRQRGLYGKAKALYLRSVETYKRLLGEEHWYTLRSMGNLASFYSSLGQHKEAGILRLKVLDAHKRLLGDDHADTLTSVNNLAMTYSDQGRHKEAEELRVGVLGAYKRLLGDEHPDTLASMNNLAITYSRQGRHREAEVLQVGVLDARKRLFGDEHPDTLTSMDYLALTYSDQGRHKEAEALQVQVLDARKRLFGDEHPDTLTSMNNLASTYLRQGRHKEAEGLQVEALDARKRVFGGEHPDTLTSMSDLALTYLRQGRHKEAEALQVEVLDARKRVLCDEHPDTLMSMNNLALTYSSQGRHKEAEELQVEALNACKRVLGDEHPDTLMSMNNLASTYSSQGRHKEAEELQVVVLDAYKRVLGDEHPYTLISLDNLASTYSDQGRHKEAEALQVKVLDAYKRVFGDEHPETLTSMNNLASTYSNQGRYKEAEVLQVKALDTYARVLGDSHPDTLTCMSWLACTYSNQGRHKKAEALEQRVVELRKRAFGRNHPPHTFGHAQPSSYLPKSRSEPPTRVPGAVSADLGDKWGWLKLIVLSVYFYPVWALIAAWSFSGCVHELTM